MTRKGISSFIGATSVSLPEKKIIRLTIIIKINRWIIATGRKI